MSTTFASEDIKKVWIDLKEDPDNQTLRNRLIERYLPLVKYNAERFGLDCLMVLS